jgi:hypothetical protein
VEWQKLRNFSSISKKEMKAKDAMTITAIPANKKFRINSAFPKFI